ncbi:MAG: phosphopyruvate hydratase [Marine Group III euryarchaeote CG-Bathy1]|uniref:Enolase n=1 Tax=Marine Group III euryarchaeote CG-Bathy1 TaxID=1889001 RepID=A0A1J5TGZ7_9ARCH|nr:MAG: phosphopyruvate hydratase [Marine Group III euryarchaeote CG-Bathy1]
MIIERINFRKIIDSRGNLAIEVDIETTSGNGRCAAPAGASTGIYEAQAYPESGINQGIKIAQKEVLPKLIGMNVENQEHIDQTLIEIDGTDNFSRIGGNIAVAISLASAKAAANGKQIELYKYLKNVDEIKIPAPMGNVLGGGAHAVGGTDIQEFLVTSFCDNIMDAMLANVAVHSRVKNKLKKRLPKHALGKGDEGAWVAPLSNLEALEIVVESAKEIGEERSVEIKTGLDMAASEFFINNKYEYKEMSLTSEEQINWVAEIIDKYDLYSVEDPIDQEDFDGWAELTSKTNALIIGDDLYTTNRNRIEIGIGKKSTNAVLIKPNQIGTLTETRKAIEMAHGAGMVTVISHRSGETTDSTISHLGVAFGCHAIKTGSVGGERIAKLNELVRIEEEMK